MSQQQAHHGLTDAYQLPENNGDMVRHLKGRVDRVLSGPVLAASGHWQTGPFPDI